jgi:serine/threonine protein phosphatase PrpC
MRIESFAASRPQQGRVQNEDAFLITRGEPTLIALADGAGNAERAAKRVLSVFQRLFLEAPADQIMNPEIWSGWVKLMDSSLLGGPQSTLIAVSIIAQKAVGICVGDSRAYLNDRDGKCRILTDGATKQRLGSGQAHPFHIELRLNAGDILLLLSDGAWTPLNLYALQRTVTSAVLKHFSDVPSAILDAAGKAGRADDMTALALRLVA